MSCSHEERTKRLVAIDGLIKHEGFFWGGGGTPIFIWGYDNRKGALNSEGNKLIDYTLSCAWLSWLEPHPYTVEGRMLWIGSHAHKKLET